MDNARNSECWYHKVCRMQNSCDACIRYLEMRYLMDNSGVPKAKQIPIVMTPDDCDYETYCALSEIKDGILSVVENGRNIYIGGETTGNGKTSWAIKLLLKYFDEVWAGNGFRVRGYFQHVPTLFNTLKNFNEDHSALKKVLEDADLVVWDEIGGVGLSNYDYGQLLMYIDNRMLNEKSNIFTSNITNSRQLQELLGARIASRIWNTSEIFILNGRDKR